MKVQTYIDNERRKLYKHSEFLRRFLNCLQCVESRLFEKNTIAFKRLFYATRIKNICWVSGRSRSVYRAYRVSRFVIKGVSKIGILPGLRKTNW